MQSNLNRIAINRFYLPEIINHFDYKNYTELGVEKGYFLNHILWNTKVSAVGVDPYKDISEDECGWESEDKNEIVCSLESQELTLMETLKLLSVHEGRCKIVRKTSTEYSKEVDDDSLDVVFIDGDHSRQGIRNDLEIFYRKVRDGGLLAGHDYGGDFGEIKPVVNVKSEVDKFCKERDLKYFVTSKNFYYWGEGLESFFIFKNFDPKFNTRFYIPEIWADG